ncbi:MAG: glycosyltransferase family 2 protein [Candidatus Bathyarchaeota archaeon]|nr:glycosyltransferase family 2 protein [Candidatus Bathyarchaeota archaeon]
MSEKPGLERGISVLIPTYNPDIEDIRQILGALANQEYRRFEVIIANDGVDFYDEISGMVPFGEVPFLFRNNPSQLGLYNSIKENLKYCLYDDILVLEQDIVPLSRKYLMRLMELLDASPSNIVTSKLVIDAETDYKKYVFYKRRIANLEVFDPAVSPDSEPNHAVEAEIAFTKADLLSKQVLSELFSQGSANSFTAQDIILTSIAQTNGKLVTSDATACEVGLSDPDTLSFFLKKEFLYGKSVLDAWRYSNKNWLKSTAYFKEKLYRVLFLFFEAVALAALLLNFLVGGALMAPILAAMLVFGLLYTQVVLFRIGFWRFWRHSRKLAAALDSGAYVALLDLAYALGILRRLLL